MIEKSPLEKMIKMRIKELFLLNPLQFILVFFFYIFTSIITVINTYILTLQFNVIKVRNFKAFMLYVCFQLGLLLLSDLIGEVADYLWEKQVQKYIHKIRMEIIDHDYEDRKYHNVSVLQNELINNLDILKKQYAYSFCKIVHSITLMFFVISALVSFNLILLIASVGFALVQLILPRFLDKVLNSSTNLISKNNKKYLESLENWLNGIDVLRRFCVSKKFFQVLSNSSANLENSYINQQKANQQLDFLNQLIYILGNAVIFILTAYLVNRNLVEFGLIATITDFNFYLFGSLMNIANYRGQIVATHDLNKKVQKLRSVCKIKNKSDVQMPTSFSTDSLKIRFNNGESIKYPDLIIKNGEKVLLTGSNGVGKTTLFKLIIGQYRGSSGTINYFDRNGNKIKPDLSKIGYITQKPIVLPTTINNNITMFDKKLEPNVEAVINKVGLTEDIHSKNKGIETVINLNEENISGGQKQKIVLARSLIRNCSIILVDEGTSAVDQSSTENIIKELVKSDKTVVFIAHNLDSNIANLFDRSIVLR